MHDAVTLAKMAANSVDSDQHVDGYIDTAHIANAQITVGKMAANSVDSDQYVDGSIDLIHMSANSVDSDQYVDGSIDTVHIADGAVTSAKLDTNIAIDSLVATTADVNGGTLDGTVIGGATPAAATFTTANDASGNIRSGRKNLIINGAMQVAQRGTSFSGVGTDNTYTIDRWSYQEGSASPIFTVTQEADAPTGLANSLKFETTTAYSLASSSYIQVSYAIEGQDLQNLAKGTSDAKQVTLSFWVKSNVTGTYAGLLWDAPNSRLNSKSYTVNSSGVWEYKTIVFSGDQTGAIDDDNTEGLAVKLILGAGTTWTGGAEGISPISGNQNRYAASQAVNVAASVSNYWQITGVQLEVGSVATEFEHRSYGEELVLCQRYYQHSNGTGAHPTNGADATSFGTGALPLGTCTIWGGSVAGHCPIYLPVTMRATPSVTKYGNSSGYIAYLSTGTSAPASDNTLTFHQDFYIGAQNANVISLNNQASGSPVWGAYGAWSAYAEL
jgi:hypothetical protein